MLLCVKCIVTALLVLSENIVSSSYVDSRMRMEASVNIFSSDRWIRLTQQPDRDATVTATFALKHSPEKHLEIESILMDLSTPNSANYGKWLSKKQAIDLLAVSDTQLQIVTDFIASFGVTDVKISEFKVST